MQTTPSPERRQQAAALNAQGGARLAAGDLDAAASLFARAAATAPDWAEPIKNLGNCWMRVQDFGQAAQHYEQALALDPAHLAAWNNLGNACRYLGQLDKAESCLRRAAELAPSDGDVLSNLGAVLLQSGRDGEAQQAFRAALAIQPRDLVALNGLGNIAAAAGHPDAAADHYQGSLALNPDQADTRLALARQYQALGRSGEILALLGPLLPADADACALAGNAALDLGDDATAAAIADAALARQPQHRESMYLRALVHSRQGTTAAAAEWWQRTLTAHPDCAEALSALLHQKLEACDWDGLELLRQRAQELAAGATAGILHPFDALLADLPGALRRRTTERLIASHFPRRPARPGPRRRAPGERIRLGYLSGDYRRHPLPALIRQLIAGHDRSRFTVTAYSLGPDDGSAERQAMIAAFDRFDDCHGLPDRAIAGRIAADGIDILIDLSGFTEYGRPGVLALRPAPCSVNWLGFVGTMGSLADVVIGDAVTIPPDEEADYGERVLRLGFYQPNDTARFAALPAAAGRAAHGLPAEGVVFCSFSGAIKLNPPLFDVWAEMLRAVPGSVLWLLAYAPPVRDNLLREWRRRGMAAERLVFAPRVALAEHLARLTHADLYLDTLPYGNGTTAADALFMGVPLLTCRGRGFCGRMGASIVTAAGMPELVLPDLDAYRRRGIELGNAPVTLAALKARLAAARAAGSAPLFQPERVLVELEAAYLTLAPT